VGGEDRSRCQDDEVMMSFLKDKYDEVKLRYVIGEGEWV
jgi:hypothetical protein